MERTTRRHLLRAAAAGGAAAAGLGVFAATSGTLTAGNNNKSNNKDNNKKGGSGHSHRNHDRPLSGSRAHVVVSFGQWDVDPGEPHDRQPIASDRLRNVHTMLPFVAEIDAGGSVSFMIGGLHQVLIYGNNRDLDDIQAGAAAGGGIIPGTPPFPPLVNYETDRVYRGLDPRVLQYVPVPPVPPGTTPMPNLVQDRIETVNFAAPGRYLVVCGVLPHFEEGMHGYVRVKA